MMKLSTVRVDGELVIPHTCSSNSDRLTTDPSFSMKYRNSFISVCVNRKDSPWTVTSNVSKLILASSNLNVSPTVERRGVPQ